MIPLADGRQMIVASVYGYSGASGDAMDYISNETLLAAALVRMKSMNHIPYYLAGDFNVDPSNSRIIQAAIEAGCEAGTLNLNRAPSPSLESTPIRP